MYAPVVSRFHTYAVEVGAVAARLHGGGDGVAGLGANGARRRWQEPWVLPEDEVDWPTVMRV